MKDIRQTSEYAKYMQSINWKAEKIDGAFCYLKKLPLIGYVAKIQRPSGFNPEDVRKINVKYKPFQIIVEPSNPSQAKALMASGFKAHNSPYLPSKTIHIDLSLSESELLSKMHQKTRYNIKVAERNKITIENSKDIEEFANFWSKEREGFSSFLYSQKNDITKFYKAFDKKIDLLIARKNNKIISGILMPRTKNIAYYMYAASNLKGKNLHAPTLITWEAIKLAKKRGCKVFDFEGIYDQRFPLKSWLGFSKFKKTFGGKEIEYSGCFKKQLCYGSNLFTSEILSKLRS